MRALRGCPSRPPPIARHDVLTEVKVRAHNERDATNEGRRDELSMTVGRQHCIDRDVKGSSTIRPPFTNL
jgi:hypothetical protein